MGPSLVILAAGVGRRFGGLKQLAPVGPGGSTIMDYTVYDALRVGFERVVMVIRRETEEAIRGHVEASFAKTVEVDYVFQDLDQLPSGFEPPSDRTNPWGTGHAMLCAAPVLDGPFAVVNADDYYGAASMTALGRQLAANTGDNSREWVMIGFRIRDTVPADGSVSRGLVVASADGWLESIDEILELERDGEGASYHDSVGALVNVAGDALVSMNLWGFTPSVIGELKGRFKTFLAGAPGGKDEFYLPVAVAEVVAEGRARVRVVPAESRWCGMTSATDRGQVQRTLRELTDEGLYPEWLWS